MIARPLMVYRLLLRPILFSLPPETAHELALNSLTLLRPQVLNQLVASYFLTNPLGELKRFGLSFPNPVGLAAGFDKNGIVLQPLAALGFGFIEAGTVTFHAQPGNERPRLFRLQADQALINRAGFNNQGAAAFAKRVARHRPGCVLGVSIGKSKIAPLDQAAEDYLASLNLVYGVADYIAVNVSSPNTPQLRELQQSEQLRSLLLALRSRSEELQRLHSKPTPMPLLVKLSPDLKPNELESIVEVLEQVRIDGIIATNTTVSRDNLRTARQKVTACGSGGLSGLPLRTKSTRMVAQLYELTKGRIPLIGVGGIFNGADAFEKICAGASLVQVYTGLIYQGPGIARKINKDLAEILQRERFASLDDAIGCRAAEFAMKE